MPDDRTPVRCRVRACPALGYWNPADPRCPMHRGPDFDPPRSPSLAEQWADDSEGR